MSLRRRVEVDGGFAATDASPSGCNREAVCEEAINPPGVEKPDITRVDVDEVAVQSAVGAFDQVSATHGGAPGACSDDRGLHGLCRAAGFREVETVVGPPDGIERYRLVVSV
jgi:hypothetical protein